ncbi:MAG: 3-deoxy-manno-octulosonate cytidylyltransferase [SAR324 cluster bacterium]|nr:3-deoxy-manno-octulosonate cytidylyltransferase [SAR324 cluster bacterium]
MKTIIVIPARYGSERFPGKPLALIAGKSMLHRVCELALNAARSVNIEVEVLVATDDTRIMNHVEELGVEAVMTPEHCKTGSDRILSAISQLSDQPDYVVNLQGDAPLTPPHFVEAILKELHSNETAQWVTPVTQLSWQELDLFRINKQSTPFSGTTVILDAQDQTIWFSKNILPAIRNELKLREESSDSPVFRHIGIYGSTLKMLQTFATLKQSPYELLEGLEQLRLLENGFRIKAVKVHYGDHPAMSGVDTPEDAKRAEELIINYQASP